jgi:hypothetical protein
VPPQGSAPATGEGDDEITQDLRIHPAAVAEGLIYGVASEACAPRPEVTDVLAARRYPDRWVLVVMTARKAFKVEVPDS